MSFKTNPKSHRLGITQNWDTLSIQREKIFHIDRKLRSYYYSILVLAVKPAGKNKKTKGLRRTMTLPVIPGKLIISKTISGVLITFSYYFNFDTASLKQLERTNNKLVNATQIIENMLKTRIYYSINNYFLFIWRCEVLTAKGISEKLKRRISKLFSLHNRFVIEEQFLRPKIWYLEDGEKRFKKYANNRYFHRTINALLILFVWSNFDCAILANIIAYELQHLRQNHSRFIKYVVRVIKWAFSYESISKRRVEGILIVINGRMTSYRRQVRRTQTKRILIGTVKFSMLSKEVNFASALAYNRFGMLTVNVSCQEKRVITLSIPWYTTTFTNYNSPLFLSSLFNIRVADSSLNKKKMLYQKLNYMYRIHMLHITQKTKLENVNNRLYREIDKYWSKKFSFKKNTKKLLSINKNFIYKPVKKESKLYNFYNIWKNYKKYSII